MLFRIEMEEIEGESPLKALSCASNTASSSYETAKEEKSDDTIKACSKTIGHLSEALRDLNKKLDLDSSNDQVEKVVRHCEPQREKMKEEMIEQLKDMGNSLLGRFGMRVDFRAVEEPNTEMQTMDNERIHKRVISPNNCDEKLVLRRKTKKWRIEEVETLKMGVNKYGKGNWKAILNSHIEIFHERTEDKWRNLTKDKGTRHPNQN